MFWILRSSLLGSATPRAWVMATTLLADITVLTFLFAATGGSASPYTMLYLAPVVVGAMTLPKGGGWLVCAASIVGYELLFEFAPGGHVHDHAAMELHLAGMFGAYALTAIALVLGFQRLRAGQRDVARAMQRARRLEERGRRLAGLATLAAGASHELSTPLSTILLVTGELARNATDPDEQADLQLIREEVERCQTVLQQLSTDVGVGAGEQLKTVDFQAWAHAALVDHPHVELTVDTGDVTLPEVLLAQVLRQLVSNARRASAPEAPILVRGNLTSDDAVLTVVDHGEGMSPETLSHAFDPFYTTHGDRGGRGLGLYFCHAACRQLGGDLHLDSAIGEGTTATLQIPRTGVLS